MSFLKRLEGVFFNPKPVFQALAEKPVWVDALALILVFIVIFTAVIIPVTQHDQLTMIRDSVKLKERLGEDAFNRMIQDAEAPATTSKIVRGAAGAVVMLVIAVLLQSLFLMLFSRLASPHGTFVQVLSALVHASLIDKFLGNGVRLVLALTKKSLMQTTTGLPLLFPRMDVTSTPYIILSQVDLFQVWMFGVLAYGLSSLLKVDLKKALFISYGFWFLKALVNIGISLFGMNLIR
jgi:cell division protein FtsL